jgi:hypothetical protein
MILHQFAQNAGFVSLSTLQPRQGFSFAWANMHRLQSSPQGAII